MDNHSVWICSGTLLSVKYVITAGLCVDGAQKFRIKLGPLHIYNNITDDNRLLYVYDNIMTTTVAYSDTFAVALITLNPKCTFTHEVQPATLFSGTFKPDFVNDSAVVSGWSENKDRQARLEWLPVKIMSDGDCLASHVAININVTMCATGYKKEYNRIPSICRNLGAAMIGDNNTLIGVSTKNCEEGSQIFARISWFKTWIEECLKAISICVSADESPVYDIKGIINVFETLECAYRFTLYVDGGMQYRQNIIWFI